MKAKLMTSGLVRQIGWSAWVVGLVLGFGSVSLAQEAKEKPAEPTKGDAPEEPKFPPSDQVLKGFTKINAPDDQPAMFTLYKRDKDAQLYAELPRDFTSKKYFIALTIASGDLFAGLQYNDLYVYWRQYDKKVALLQPNVETRSTGDQESKDSIKRIFTDRVLIEAPIVTMGPGGGPVIDLDDLFVGKAPVFFGSDAQGINPTLARIVKSKAFPKNVEVAFEAPVGASRGGMGMMFGGGGPPGQLRTFHYSVSEIGDNPAYRPRLADTRIGYFTTSYNDLGKYSEPETWVRYINRWHLEKADPSLKLSPPKEPIIFYVEHTAPIRYRRWVRAGIEYWNKAFEKVGISQAIEVRYQDARTGEHMDKDPEDVRWNFVRWLNNDIGTAIGPSRVHPLTGQILDADIVLTDGWIRAYWRDFNYVLPNLAMEGFSAETLAWIEKRPMWDPRIRLAEPNSQLEKLRERQMTIATPFGGHAIANRKTEAIGDDEFDGLIGRQRQMNGFCSAATMRAFDVASFRMMRDMLDDPAPAAGEPKKDEAKKDEKKEEKKDDKPKEEMIDGMPESFIGPLLADLVAHEVGHTLGLRHNFKSSSIYSVAKINSPEIKGKAPFAGSVMDYLPVNINMESGEIQGDYAMISVGPYDMWAIEYGYTSSDDLKPILQRVAEPDLRYATDEDTGGPDPLARRYDFGADPINYAKSQYKLAKYNRERIIDKFVKDGESWAKARRGYEITLSMQMRAISMMSGWVGGAYVYRDKKGDKDGRAPIEVVPVEIQREALDWVIAHTFPEDIYGITPDILSRMTVDKWLDNGGIREAMSEPTWPIHDRILGLQSAVLTMLMNPTTLRRVYDNEFRVSSDKDALTLPELLDKVSASIWNELEKKGGEHTPRKPLISSLRRNLQQEHLDRLIDLSIPQIFSSSVAQSAISNLAMSKIRELKEKVASLLGDANTKLDPYSKAHLEEVQAKITKLLESQMIFNAKDIGGGGGGLILLLGEQGQNGQAGSARAGEWNQNSCSCPRCREPLPAPVAPQP
ncbi:zinc-dependent metalloprotease [bacterium]|nr:zinc-dependent metalloprotease [bacterium]